MSGWTRTISLCMAVFLVLSISVTDAAALAAEIAQDTEEVYALPVDDQVYAEEPEMDLSEATEPEQAPESDISEDIGPEESGIGPEMPEVFLGADGLAGPGEEVVITLSGVFLSGGEAAEDLHVDIPAAALPVVSVEGPEAPEDYRVTETGVILAAGWLESLAPGETDVVIAGSDGAAYVQPIMVMETVYAAADVSYDVNDLMVNGGAVSTDRGDGWAWDPETFTLTLSNYNGGAILIGFEGAKIHLADGTHNIVEGGVMTLHGLKITGAGTLYSDITNAKGTVTLNNRGHMKGDIANASGKVAMKNVHMMGGEIYLGEGSLSVSDSYVQCRYMNIKGSVTIRDSLVYTLGYNDGHVAYYDIYATGKITAKSSVLIGSFYKSKKKFSYDKYTALFKNKAGEYTLAKNATIKHTWTLPEAEYRVPKKRKLTIASKKTLYVAAGGYFYDSGTVKGKLFKLSYSKWHVEGAPEMVSGTSGQLKAVVESWKGALGVMTGMVWRSLDPDIASVDSNGMVTISPLAPAGGKVTISCCTEIADHIKTREFVITVKQGARDVVVMRDGEEIEAIELWLDPANKKAALTASVTPLEASDAVTWKTTKKKVAAVSKDGVVTAKAAGSCYVYAVSADGTEIESQRVKVTVKKAPKSVKLSPKKATLAYDADMKLGTQRQLSVKLSSGSASTIRYTSSNKKVAVVDENGVVTAVGKGKAKIKASAYNKKSATCTVTVKAAPESMVFSKQVYRVAVDDTVTVSAKPASKAYTPVVAYGCENANIAAVDAETGLVKPAATGTARLFAKAFNGASGYAELQVLDAPEALKLNVTSKTLKKGKKYTIKPTVSREDGGETTASYTFKSSKPSVCKVSSSGRITARKKGTAVITVTTHNGLSATVKIRVK